MTKALLAEGAIEVGHHETANWFGLTVNIDTVISSAIAAVIVIGLAFFLRAKVTSTAQNVKGKPSGLCDSRRTRTSEVVEQAIDLTLQRAEWICLRTHETGAISEWG